MIAEAVNPALGRCDRCNRSADELRADGLGHVCPDCWDGNPDNQQETS